MNLIKRGKRFFLNKKKENSILQIWNSKISGESGGTCVYGVSIPSFAQQCSIIIAILLKLVLIMMHLDLDCIAISAFDSISTLFNRCWQESFHSYSLRSCSMSNANKDWPERLSQILPYQKNIFFCATKQYNQ